MLLGCFPIKNVEDVSGYLIVAPKNKKQQNHVFLFQINRSQKTFNNYLKERFKDEINFSPQSFSIEIEAVLFHVQILSKAESSKYLSFMDLLLKKEDPELVLIGKEKKFVFIIVSDNDGNDALSTDSFYRYIVEKYLNNLRMGFRAY